MTDETITKLVRVYDVQTGHVRSVTLTEAAAGLVRYGRTLGPGTPACGEMERHAIELLTERETP